VPAKDPIDARDLTFAVRNHIVVGSPILPDGVFSPR
jgi:hypothetical protein